jgi:hypothetical protein
MKTESAECKDRKLLKGVFLDFLNRRLSLREKRKDRNFLIYEE